ncbi:mucin-22-like [Hoplias malabaricus]|uniref:mucin-22-like n=1 Tax=Hoplias malabaricus TaxID=27720 RepID=UPI0034621EE5
MVEGLSSTRWTETAIEVRKSDRGLTTVSPVTLNATSSDTTALSTIIPVTATTTTTSTTVSASSISPPTSITGTTITTDVTSVSPITSTTFTTNGTVGVSSVSPATSTTATNNATGVNSINPITFTAATTSTTAAAPSLFYQFGAGSGDTVFFGSDDGSSPAINLLTPFIFFGHAYSQIYINVNGHLTFDHPWYGFTPYLFPAYGVRDIIAPLWTDLSSNYGRGISYQQYTNGSVLSQASQDINQYFPGQNINISWVWVATWSNESYYNQSAAQASFQVVLISAGNSSFVLMNYGVITPTNLPVEAGYDTVNSMYFYLIPRSNDTSFILNLKNTSNVNMTGRWAFNVTGDGPRTFSPQDSQPYIFYPYGSEAGDNINLRIDDGSSPPIGLQSPFTFFGRTYPMIYVNNNGFLTFDQPLSTWVPVTFTVHGGRDIIAPLWTDIDNRQNGVISYNQYTNGSVLSWATQDINQYYPGVNFNASWVFVATWDKVGYYSNTGSETSFQVVLITGSNFSFVLMNYGNIAPTANPAEAGYDTNTTDYFISLSSNDKFTIQSLRYSSNRNVPGRWVFLVNQPDNAITRDNTLAARLNVMSTLNLTDTYNQQIFLQQFQNALRKKGIPSTVKVKLTRPKIKSPSPRSGPARSVRHPPPPSSQEQTRRGMPPSQEQTRRGTPPLQEQMRWGMLPSQEQTRWGAPPSQEQTLRGRRFLWSRSGSFTGTGAAGAIVTSAETAGDATFTGTDAVGDAAFSAAAAFSGAGVAEEAAFSGAEAAEEAAFTGTGVETSTEAGACAARRAHAGVFAGLGGLMSTLLRDFFNSTTPPQFYPFGAGIGDTVIASSDDGSSPVINLQTTFFFFEHAYSQIYVNVNGDLTFNQSWYGFTPYLFPAHDVRDIIAPLWTDFDSIYGGSISYQQYTNGSVLSQASQAINQYFPGQNINASWVFVATWSNVPYYNLHTAQSSFQAVLISAGSSSFVLMNYGAIATTNQTVEAGYDTVNSTHYFKIPNSNNGSYISNLMNTSNVNVAGRWAFNVTGEGTGIFPQAITTKTPTSSTVPNTSTTVLTNESSTSFTATDTSMTALTTQLLTTESSTTSDNGTAAATNESPTSSTAPDTSTTVLTTQLSTAESPTVPGTSTTAFATQLPTTESFTVPDSSTTVLTTQLSTAESPTVPDTSTTAFATQLPTTESSTVPDSSTTAFTTQLLTTESSTVPDISTTALTTQLLTTESSTTSDNGTAAATNESPTSSTAPDTSTTELTTQLSTAESPTVPGTSTTAFATQLPTTESSTVPDSSTTVLTTQLSTAESPTVPDTSTTAFATQLPTTESSTVPDSSTTAFTTQLLTTESSTVPDISTTALTTQLLTTESSTTSDNGTAAATNESPTSSTAPDTSTTELTTQLSTAESPTVPGTSTTAFATQLPTTESSTVPDSSTTVLTTQLSTAESPTVPDTSTTAFATQLPTTESSTVPDSSTTAFATQLPATESSTVPDSSTTAFTTQLLTTESSTVPDISTTALTTQLLTTESSTTSDNGTAAATNESPTSSTAPDTSTTELTTQLSTAESPTVPGTSTTAFATQLPTTESSTVPDSSTTVLTTQLSTAESPTVPDTSTTAFATQLPTTESSTVPDSSTTAFTTQLLTTESSTVPDISTTALTTQLLTTESSTTSDNGTAAATNESPTSSTAPDTSTTAFATQLPTTESSTVPDSSTAAFITQLITTESSTVPDTSTTAFTTQLPKTKSSTALTTQLPTTESSRAPDTGTAVFTVPFITAIPSTGGVSTIIPVYSTAANTSTTATTPPQFYPFGAGIGDTVIATSDDGSSPVINLQTTFIFFKHAYSQIYLNVNGHLTFDQPWYTFTPDLFPAHGVRDIIAPLWTDLDSSFGGSISYQQYTNGSVLSQASQDINQYFPGQNITASWVFVATWFKVSYFNQSTARSSFQVVLMSAGTSSFVLMNYGDIAPTNLSTEAGYDTVNSTDYFLIPRSNDSSYISNLISTTNVNVTGRWAFNVTGEVPRNNLSQESLPYIFYPFGSEAVDNINPISDDGSSPAISLQSPFHFFGNTCSEIYVNNNGYLTFDQPLSTWVPVNFTAYGGRDVIAPLWTDIDNRQNGVISYNQYTNGSVLSRATQDINQYYPGVNFDASWVFVATWDKVGYYRNTGSETSFQVVLITGGNFSFVLMNYGDIAPTSNPAEAGYDTNTTGYFISLWSNDKFTIQTLRFLSNVNVPGRWAFLVNQPDVAITKDNIFLLHLNVLSSSDLTDPNNQGIFLQEFQDTLRSRGIPFTVKLNLTYIQKTNP